MTDEKTRLLKELDDARDYLWGVLSDLDPAIEIYPGWKKREFFTHIGGWEAIVFEVFRDTLSGVPVKPYPYSGLDAANAIFVAERQSLTLDNAQLECEINRFALKTLLTEIPPEDYGKSIQFPWGSDTVKQFIEGAIDHELGHARDIVKLKERG